MISLGGEGLKSSIAGEGGGIFKKERNWFIACNMTITTGVLSPPPQAHIVIFVLLSNLIISRDFSRKFPKGGENI